MADGDWRESKHYGGKIAWFNGFLYRLTNPRRAEYMVEFGGEFFRQWKSVGTASSRIEAEAMCLIHSEEQRNEQTS